LLPGRTTVQSTLGTLMGVLAPLPGQSGTVRQQKLSYDSPQPFTLPDPAKVILALFCSSSTMNSSSIDVHKMEARKDFKQNFRYLGNLLRTIAALPHRFIEHDQLAVCNISVTDFSLHSDLAYGAVPRFFEPFPHDLMEESFKQSSELGDDVWWPEYDPQYLSCFTEPQDVEAILRRCCKYVIAEQKESPSGRSMWRARW
jgi:hypothetical protein